MNARDLVRRLFHTVAPRFIIDARTRSILIRRARQLSRQAEGLRDPLRLWRLLNEYPEFLPLQREFEVVRLLDLVADLAPSRICEIGTAAGGTAFLLARVAAPGAILVTLDLSLRPGQAEALSILGGRDRRVHAVIADSHARETAPRARQILGGVMDMVMIDGDHRYEGVSTDFELFLPQVRAGGLIAFHDIVPDSLSRGGIATRSDAGGVPRFWREISARYAGRTTEIIEDPQQDACGIGVLRVGS